MTNWKRSSFFSFLYIFTKIVDRLIFCCDSSYFLKFIFPFYYRLYRLLQRHKFDDAEAFAHQFKLDVELVHKERVKHYMELLQPWSLRCDASEDVLHFNNLLCLLNKIEDVEFVCEACIKTLTTDLTKMQALLDYASDRLKKTNVTVRNLWVLISSVFQLSCKNFSNIKARSVIL